MSSPYIMFSYSIRSPYTKETYFRRLRRFFDAISLMEHTFEDRCNYFAEKGKQDPDWAFNCVLKFVSERSNESMLCILMVSDIICAQKFL